MKELAPRRLDIKVLTHNVLFNKATPELGHIVKAHNIDIACLQEAGTDIPDALGGLLLAAHTMLLGHHRVGLATYYNPQRWRTARVSSHPLTPTKVTEFLTINPRGNRLLEVRLFPAAEGEAGLVVANGHASNLLALKSGRLRQLVEGGQITRDAAFAHHSSGIAVYDTNLPYLTAEEIRIVEKETGLRYAGPPQGVATYKKYPGIMERLSDPGKKTFDRVLVTPDLEQATVEALPRNATSSDHIAVVAYI